MSVKTNFALLCLLSVSLLGCSSIPDRGRTNGVLDVMSAARQGGASAQFVIGTYYNTGTNLLPANADRAAAWFKRGADTDFPHAKYGLARLYVEGRGVPQDPVEVNRLLEEAAKQGYLPAQRDYAKFLYDEAPPEIRDPIRAYGWLAAVRAYNIREYQELAPIRAILRRGLTGTEFAEAEALEAAYPGLYPPWNRR